MHSSLNATARNRPPTQPENEAGTLAACAAAGVAGGRSLAFRVKRSDARHPVLRYLGSRLTVTEIASELYVSVNTLKTHVKSVYRKLGVSSRREAIAEGRRLGLI
jgi:LuxR family maltose regulon positive regulatory protein